MYDYHRVMADFNAVQEMTTYLTQHYSIRVLVSGAYGFGYGNGVLGISYLTLRRWRDGLNVIGFWPGKIRRLVAVDSYVKEYYLRNRIYPSETLLIMQGRRLDAASNR